MTACLSPNGLNRFDAPAALTRLLVATADGIVALERGAAGGAWHAGASSLVGKHVSALATVPGQAAIVAGTHGDGVFVSDDAGTHWQSRSEGLNLRDIYTVAAVHRGDAVLLYAGTQPAALFRSDDLGRTWRELPALRGVPGTDQWTFPAPPRIAHTKMLAFHPRDPNIFYAAIEQGALLKTTDGGQSWRELDGYSRADDRAYKDIHQVLLQPSRPERMFLTTGVGLYTSGDAGEHWERLTGPEFRLAYPDHIVLSPDEGTLFLSGGATDPGVWRRTRDAGTTVVRSRDGGRTWLAEHRGAVMTPRANIEAMSLVSHPGGYSVFLGNTDGEIYASEDGGESWAEIADGLAPVSKGDHHILLNEAARAAAEAARAAPA